MTSLRLPQRVTSLRLPQRVTSRLAFDLLLFLISVLGAAYLSHAFYPGRANVDIAFQAAQALGTIPYTDWHPPIIAALWGWLYQLTGTLGTLFLLQVGALFFASWLLAVFVHHKLACRRWAVVPLLLPWLPWTVGQISTMWKDTVMAVALLLATVVLIWIRPGRPRTFVLLVPAGLLLVFATCARKNAVFAIIPCAVYIAWLLLRAWAARHQTAAEAPQRSQHAAPTSPRQRWRCVVRLSVASAVVLGVLGGAVITTDAVINRTHRVQAVGQLSQVLLDDVMFSVPTAELNASAAPQELKDHINSAREKCFQKKEIWDAYWNCYGRGASGEPFSPLAYQDELRDLWLHHVITHPARYLEYRAAVFSYYFFSSTLEYWDRNYGVDGHKLGLKSRSINADYLLRPYVVDFAAATFPFVFKPWFWFALGVTTVLLARRVKLFRTEIIMLSSSGLLYILGYFPIVPANHFRYTLWSALAISAALFLLCASLRKRT